jgi:hypothetical protein
MKEQINLITGFVILQSLLAVMFFYSRYSYKKSFNYDPEPDEYQIKYNEKHPVQEVLPPYFNNTSTIKLRRFIDNTGCVYKGELNGRGRSVYTHVGYKECTNCRKAIKNDVRDVLLEIKPNRIAAYDSINHVLKQGTYTGRGAKNKKILKILELTGY